MQRITNDERTMSHIYKNIYKPRIQYFREIENVHVSWAHGMSAQSERKMSRCLSNITRETAAINQSEIPLLSIPTGFRRKGVLFRTTAPGRCRAAKNPFVIVAHPQPHRLLSFLCWRLRVFKTTHLFPSTASVLFSFLLLFLFSPSTIYSAGRNDRTLYIFVYFVHLKKQNPHFVHPIVACHCWHLCVIHYPDEY